MDGKTRAEYNNLHDQYRAARNAIVQTMKDLTDRNDTFLASPALPQLPHNLLAVNSVQTFCESDNETWTITPVTTPKLDIETPKIFAHVHRPCVLRPSERISPTYTSSRPKKGHRKSRHGCFNCKRRKVKVLVCFQSTPTVSC